MSNVWAKMPCVQLSHNILVNCIDNRQNQLFSEMSLRDVMELPSTECGSQNVAYLKKCWYTKVFFTDCEYLNNAAGL